VSRARTIAALAWFVGAAQLILPIAGTDAGLIAAACGNIGLLALGSARIGMARWFALVLGELGLVVAAAHLGLGWPEWLTYLPLPLWLLTAGVTLLRAESRRPRRVNAAAAVGPGGESYSGARAHMWALGASGSAAITPRGSTSPQMTAPATKSTAIHVKAVV
jgi:hypothetical protein